MNDFARLRGQTLALVPELMSIARRRGATTAADRLARAETRLQRHEFTVVVCGEFKRGKSSMLNALLEEDPPLFPVDAVVATSVVSVASWGEAERIIVQSVDQGEREIVRSELVEYVTESGNPENFREIRPVVSIKTPNRRLESGVVLVDTPGVGGMLVEHTAVTTTFLPSADVIVFVLDFTQPLTASEVSFLRQAADSVSVQGDIDGLILVVTKSDLLDESQRAESLANTVAKLADVTGRSAESLHVVPVSSRAKLRYLSAGDQQQLVDSNFPALEAVLWPAVARRRARIVLSAALSDLDATVRALFDPLHAELSAHEAKTAQQLAEVQSEVERRRRYLDELHSGRAQWRGRLRDDLLRIAKGAADEIDIELDGVWHRAHSRYLLDPRYLADPDQLVVKLGADAAIVATRVTEKLQREAAQTVRFASRTHGLDLQTPEVAGLPAPPVPDLGLAQAVPVPETGGRGWEKVRQGAVGATEGSSIGVTSGWVLGAVVGTVIVPGLGTYLGSVWGGIVGSAVGTVFGAVGSVRQVSAAYRSADLEKQRRHIADVLEPLQAIQRRALQGELDRIITWLVETTVAELDDKINRERESTSDALRRLGEVADLTNQRAAERVTEVQAEMAPLQRIREEVRELASAAEALAHPA
jgi:predicted GTPase